MTAAGPLYQWPADRTRVPDAAVPGDGLTHREDVGPVLNQSEYQALWFHLAARDPCITRAWTDGIDPAQGLCALHRPGVGTAWISRDGTLHHTAAPELADRLTRHITDWDRTGRPRISAWSCTMRQTGDPRPVYLPALWGVG